MNNQIEWFCYHAVNEKLLPAEFCRQVERDCRRTGVELQLDVLLAATKRLGPRVDLHRLKQLAELAVRQAETLGEPPTSVFHPQAGHDQPESLAVDASSQPELVVHPASPHTSAIRPGNAVRSVAKRALRLLGADPLVTVGCASTVLIVVLFCMVIYVDKRSKDDACFDHIVTKSRQEESAEQALQALSGYFEEYPDGRNGEAIVGMMEETLGGKALSSGYGAAVSARNVLMAAAQRVPRHRFKADTQRRLRELQQSARSEEAFRNAEKGRSSAGEDKSALADAFALYCEAAEAGHMLARVRVGQRCERGEGTGKNLSRAFACYKLAAEEGCEAAYVELGRCYLEGIGTAADLQAALLWLQTGLKREVETARSAVPGAPTPTEELYREAQRRDFRNQGKATLPVLSVDAWKTILEAVGQSEPGVYSSKDSAVRFVALKGGNRFWEALGLALAPDRDGHRRDVIGMFLTKYCLERLLANPALELRDDSQVTGRVWELVARIRGLLSKYPDEHSQYVLRANLVPFNHALASYGFPELQSLSIDETVAAIEHNRVTMVEGFLALLGCSEQQVGAAITSAPTPMVLITAGEKGNSKVFRYSGNPSIRGATSTLYTFWKGRLWVITVEFPSENAEATYDSLRKLIEAMGNKMTDVAVPLGRQCERQTDDLAVEIHYTPEESSPTLLLILHKGIAAEIGTAP